MSMLASIKCLSYFDRIVAQIFSSVYSQSIQECQTFVVAYPGPQKSFYDPAWFC